MTRDDRGSSRDEGRGSSRGRESERGGRDRGGDDRGSSRGGSSGFSYRQRSAEATQKRAEQGSKNFDTYLRDDIKMFKPNEGANTIRILPPTFEDADSFGIDAWVHFSVGPDQQSYLCLNKMKGEPCPVCEELDRAKRDREDEQYVNDLKPTRRVLFYLLDRDHEKDGVQAWAAPQSMEANILRISVDKKTGETLPLDDPENGFDVEFDKRGKGIGTKYEGIAIARRESPLGDKRALQFAIDNPLPSILEYFSYDHILRVLGGGGAHKTRDDTPAPSPRRETSRDDPPANESRDRSRGRSSEPELTWEGVHEMSASELAALVESKKLKINPDKAASDTELADWICEDLDLKAKPDEDSRAQRGRDAPANDSPTERLRSMRESRDR